jgi:hypothetical protein
MMSWKMTMYIEIGWVESTSKARFHDRACHGQMELDHG